MSSMDNRVVQMKFENEQFNSRIKSSEEALKKFQEALKMKDAGKAFQDINNESEKVKLDGIKDAIDKVNSHFSLLGVATLKIFSSIIDGAINCGKKVANALFIQPRTDGFVEYEQKMTSIQTMMAATGEKLPVVKAALEDLNVYADKTIYSFADMTQNVSKFTNAGISLKDSVGAIKGVSNAAALAGANANEASHAMYNFAQALSSGYVKLIDWKSIENANMATMSFKEELLKTAAAMGTVKAVGGGMYEVLSTNAKGKEFQDVISSTKNFNDSLSYQWMTSEVLTATLNRYADETSEVGKAAFAAAQDIKTFSQWFDTLREAAGSGWALTFELIIGDFEEAKALFKDLNDEFGGLIEGMSDARNNMLKEWAAQGGRDSLIKSFWNVYNAIKSVIKPIHDAFRNIFPPTSGEQLANLTKSIERFTEKLKISDKTAKVLYNTFNTVFSVAKVLRDLFGGGLYIALKGFTLVIREGWTILRPFLSVLTSCTSMITEFIAKFTDIPEVKTLFVSTFRVINETLNAFGVLFKKEFYKIANSESVRIVLTTLLEIKDTIKMVAQSASESLNTLSDKIKSSVSAIKIDKNPFNNLEKTVTTSSGKINNRIDSIKESFDKLKSIDLSPLSEGFKKFIEEPLIALYNFTIKAVKKIRSTIKSLFDYLTGPDFLNFDTLNLFGLGILIKTIRDFKKDKNTLISILGDFAKSHRAIVSSITKMGNAVTETFETMQNKLKADILKTIAISIGMITASIFVLSKIDADKLAISLGSVSVLMLELWGFSKSISKFNVKNFTSTSFAVVELALALDLMAAAVKKLSKIDTLDLVKGLAGLGIVMVEMNLMMKSMSNLQSTVKMEGIIAFSIALNLIASAVKKLGKLNIISLTKGLSGLTIILAELSLFMNSTKFSNVNLSAAAGILLLSTALKIIASAVSKLGKLDIVSLVKGLSSIGLILLELNIFIKSMGSPEKMIAIGAGITILSIGLRSLAGSVKKLGKLDIPVLVKGLSALGIILAELTVAMKSVGSVKGLSSVAFLAMAAAMNMLVVPLKVFGSMSLWSIAKGLTMLAGSLATMALFAAALSPLAAVLPVISLFVLSIAGSIVGVGIGINALAVGLAALGSIGSIAFNQMIKNAKKLFTLLAPLAKEGAKAIVAFVTEVSKKSVEFAKAIGIIVIEGIKEFARRAPEFIAAGLKMVIDLLKSIKDHIVEFTILGAEILINFLNGLATKLPDLITAGVNVTVAFIKGVTDNLPKLIQAGWDFIIAFINGIADGLEKNRKPLLDAMYNLGMAIVKFLYDGILYLPTKLLEAGSKLLENFKTGIKNKLEDVYNLGVRVAGRFKKGIEDGARGAAEAARTAARQVREAFNREANDSGPSNKRHASGKKMADDVSRGARAGFKIKSPSRVFREMGYWNNVGLAEGLEEYSYLSVDAAESLANQTTDKTKEAFKDVADNLEAQSDISLEKELTIKPVIDLSDFDPDDIPMPDDFPFKPNPTSFQGYYKTTKENDNTDIERQKEVVKEEISNMFNINAVIREEADIKRIARELFELQREYSRERGILV